MNSKTNGPMKSILTTTVTALFLLGACGSDANSATEAAEDVPAATDTAPTTVPEKIEEAAPAEEAEEVSELDPMLEEAVAGMTVAWGSADGDLAWSFDSERCRGGLAEAPEGFVDSVVGWGTTYSGATATDITAVVDGDRAVVTYDVYDGAGDFIDTWRGQPWIFSDGDWLRDAC